MRNTNTGSMASDSASSIKKITVAAMLAALSYVLAFLEIPMPFSPFLKFDFSDFPAMLAALMFNPLYGVVIECIKNALRIINSSSGGIGELANFIMGSSFILSASLLFRRKRTVKNTVISFAVACVVMGIVAGFTNYFILLPLYSQFMPIDRIIASVGEIFPFIKSKTDVCIYHVFPFNIIKGIIIAATTAIVLPKLSAVINRKKA